MVKIPRREFISKFTKLVAATTFLASGGCSRLLRWSEEKDVAKVKQTKSNKLTVPNVEKLPDLSVVQGEDPATNVKKAIDLIGGIERFVGKGNRVVIKPNLLTAREPEFAVTTNPLVIGALVKMCVDAGASEVTVLDNPTSSPAQVYKISGIAEATQNAGGRIKVLTDRNFENTVIPQGRILKQFPLVKDVFEADAFINVPIAKTHGLAILTMAMKNLMGIMGAGRSMMHQDFDQKICDLNTLVKPHLVVLDAYRILTAHGPSGGDLSDVSTQKKVIAGTSQVAVDAFGTTLFDMKPTDLQYLVKAKEQGLGEIDLSKLDIKEEDIG